jgi:hypothetical protein
MEGRAARLSRKGRLTAATLRTCNYQAAIRLLVFRLSIQLIVDQRSSQNSGFKNVGWIGIVINQKITRRPLQPVICSSRVGDLKTEFVPLFSSFQLCYFIDRRNPLVS